MTTSIKLPEHQTIWQHHNGNYYRVYDTTNEHTERPDEYPPTVSYIGENGKRWSKPLPNFLEKMTLTDLKVMPIRVGERVVFFERLPVRGADTIGKNPAEELCDIVSISSYLFDLELDPTNPQLRSILKERVLEIRDSFNIRLVTLKLVDTGLQFFRWGCEHEFIDFGKSPPLGHFTPRLCKLVSQYYPDSKLAEVFAPVMRLNLPE